MKARDFSRMNRHTLEHLSMAAGLLPVVAAEQCSGDDTLRAVHNLGCVHVTGVVAPEACTRAYNRCEALLREGLDDCGVTSIAETPDGNSEHAVAASRTHFGDVFSPLNRRDMKVPLDDAVIAVIGPALEVLAPLLEQHLTPDCGLCELACLVSDPGAEAQPLHPDTAIAGDKDNICTVITAFISLQQIDTIHMGPTEVVLGSHCIHAHDALRSPNRCRGGGAERLIEAGYGAPVPAMLGIGDVLVMDSRVVHRGGSNEMKKHSMCDNEFGAAILESEVKPGRRRMLLYVSFKAPYTTVQSSFSLCDPLKHGRNLRLRSHSEWCKGRTEKQARKDRDAAISKIETERDDALAAISLSADKAIAKETERWERHKDMHG